MERIPVRSLLKAIKNIYATISSYVGLELQLKESISYAAFLF